MSEQPFQTPMLPLFALPEPAGAPPPPAPAGPPTTRPAGPGGAGTEGTATVGTATATRPEVEVRVSRRRKKSAVSFWEGDRIVVVVPAHVPEAKRAELVDWLVERTKARRPGAGITDEDLSRRAATLAQRYVDGVVPSSVRWVTNQRKRWGSCTSGTGEIRLSHRLQSVPGWVLDAVLVHELAHLLHPDHSERFHRVANRYPRQQEAALFLEGFSHGLELRAGH